MASKYQIKLVYITVALCLFGRIIVADESQSETYLDTRHLLSKLQDRRLDSDKLATLFEIGDKRIADLIRMLDDQDPELRLHAQLVIRYLGNDAGMKALREWYGRQRGEYRIVGPVPLPLSEWDYHVISAEVISKPPQAWRDRGVQYIYALALDGSSKAKAVLEEVVKKAGEVDESTLVGCAIRRVQAGSPDKLFAGQENLARLVQKNAFFIPPGNEKHVSARLLGFNGAGDKALVEIHLRQGDLAEEWYHVVISKAGRGWKFFTIDLVAIS